MDGNEPREQLRMCGQQLQNPPAQRWTPFERQEQAAHQCGPARKAAMFPLISPQVATLQGSSQGQRLLEAEAQTFPGNRVHRSGGIANQHHTAAIKTAE